MGLGLGLGLELGVVGGRLQPHKIGQQHKEFVKVLGHLVIGLGLGLELGLGLGLGLGLESKCSVTW